MQRLQSLAACLALSFFGAAPALAIDISVDSLSLSEYNQGVLVGDQYEVEVFFPTGDFTTATYNLDNPASSGPMNFDGTDAGQDIWFIDENFAAANGSNTTITLSGGNSAALTFQNLVGAPGGVPQVTAFNVVGTTLVVDWDCTLCTNGANSTNNFLVLGVFDVATDGDIFETVQFVNTPQGTSGQNILDISSAALGNYVLELEFFSNRAFVDALSDPGNNWNVVEGRSALNGGFGFTVTPEPNTAMLLGMGVVALSARRRKRV